MTKLITPLPTSPQNPYLRRELDLFHNRGKSAVAHLPHLAQADIVSGVLDCESNDVGVDFCFIKQEVKFATPSVETGASSDDTRSLNTYGTDITETDISFQFFVVLSGARAVTICAYF